ncbi:murein hydrolase activator EnvC family protein [Flavobacterium ardleyense]|uniref:murein hydrolase activator EnvC family protein n=1 Tax=Flavobacterium ardleyense TaxID=2038737 RepID=UPI00298BF4E7|nr:peptidoglycan DD-metalloendopeptidase family protein [Flavobacterium ardleyense]
MPKFILSLFFILITSLSWSQSAQDKLEARKLQIQKEIRENQALLKSVRTKEKSTTSELLLQKNKIGLKEKLIQTTERQSKLLANDMYINQKKINELTKELVELRADYAELIVKSYKSRSEQSRAMFLLSSESFLQAYKRAQYMKQYARFRKSQGEELKKKTKDLEVLNETLKGQKAEKEKLLVENRKEKESLELERKDTEKIFQGILKDKKNITTDIRKKEQESKKIDKEIDRLIRAAIAEANRKAAAEAAAKAAALAKANPSSAPAKKAAAEAASTKAAPVSSTKIALTPEGEIVAANFRANKNKLPWPVERGVVTLGYGQQAHPVHRSLVIYNSGVEITTEKGAIARAVFGGEVSSVMVLSPINKIVIIQHGDFFSVYQNLNHVTVNKGDKVSLKQSIGTVNTNGETGATVIKFLISQNATYVNPQQWLSGM